MSKVKFEDCDVIELQQNEGEIGIYQAIERAGRICTNTTPKEDSDGKVFTKRMIESTPQHGRPLEFGTVYLKLKWYQFGKMFKYFVNPYSRIHKFLYVTTNYRVIVEHNWYKDVETLLCKPTEYHEKRRTLLWTISRVQADSFRTHCSISSLMQSTRYCNYSKDRFGGVTYILPQWAYSEAYDKDGDIDNVSLVKTVNWLRKNSENFKIYYNALSNTSDSYLKLLKETETKKGMTSELARGVLPLDIKTVFIQCAFERDWEHFLYLRVEKNAHPDAQFIAAKAKLLLGLDRNY